MEDMKKNGYLAMVLIGVSLVFTGCKKSDLITFDEYSHFKGIKTADYVKIGEYEGLTITKGTIQVLDFAIDQKIASVLYDAGYYVDANDTPVTRGMQVEISMTGTVEGISNEGFTSNDYEFVYNSEEHVMDGFVAELEGARTGEIVKFNLVIPSTFKKEELVGKTASFTVTIDNVQSYYVPTLNEQFIQENSDYSTIDEYRESLVTVIKEEKLAQIKENKKAGVWEVISDSSSVVSYPEGLLEEKEEQLRNSLNTSATVYGIDIEEYVKSAFGVSFEEFVKLSVKQDLLLDAIGRAENITLTKKEYEEGLETYARSYGYNSTEAFVEKLGEAVIKEALLWDKVRSYLAEQVTIE
jgi:trigger factor